MYITDFVNLMHFVYFVGLMNRFGLVFEAIIWHLLVLGCLQPVAALTTGAILCPIASFFVILSKYDSTFFFAFHFFSY